MSNTSAGGGRKEEAPPPHTHTQNRTHKRLSAFEGAQEWMSFDSLIPTTAVVIQHVENFLFIMEFVDFSFLDYDT